MMMPCPNYLPKSFTDVLKLVGKGRDCRSYEVLALKDLTKLPGFGACFLWNKCFSITCGDSEGEFLANEFSVGLPFLAPIPFQGCPLLISDFDLHFGHVSCSSHIRDSHHVEVRIPSYFETNTSLFLAWNPR